MTASLPSADLLQKCLAPVTNGTRWPTFASLGRLITLTHDRSRGGKFLCFVAAALLLQIGIAMVGIAQTSACTQNTNLVGQCFTVHGRLSVHANMRPYLWPIGTHRLLGIGSPEGAIIMPTEIERIFASPPFDQQLFADFEVCPFTRARPGIMQMVCIAAARNLKIRKAV